MVYYHGNLENSYNVGGINLQESYNGTWVDECCTCSSGKASNCYSLQNLINVSDVKTPIVDGRQIVSSSQLQGSNGVNLLNDGQEDGPWTYDKDINNGFPILKWQLTNEKDN